jgi:nucleotide-binding universal stress UspA family protein
MKSILLHVQDDGTLDNRLQTALSLTRATGGHLRCLHVTPVEAYVAMDTFGGVFVMQDVLKSIEEHECDLRQRLEAQLSKEGVSWDYLQTTGNVENVIVAQAALADVIVVGRDVHSDYEVASPVRLIGDLLHRSRTPLLVPAKTGKALDPNGTMIVAWNGSYEAANAVRAALSLLELASKVEVVRVDGEAEKMFPATELLEYLSRHGVHAELRLEETVDEHVPAALLSCAKQIGATALIMGGYSHSRIGEFIFGGVTRTLLAEAPITLFVAR